MAYKFIHIDKKNKMPLYSQLETSILKAINSGKLKAGDKLPTEEEVCNEYGISRIVVKQAYNDLLNQGKLIRERGRGTFIKEIDDRGLFLQRVYSYDQEMSILKKKPRTDVVLAEVVACNSEIATLLDLEIGASCFHLERMRYADNKPFDYSIDYLPMDIFPGLENHDFGSASLYRTLESEYHSIPTHAKRTIFAQNISKSIAKYLTISEGAAVLVVQSVVCDQHGRTVEVSFEYMSGNAHKFDFDANLNY